MTAALIVWFVVAVILAAIALFIFAFEWTDWHASDDDVRRAARAFFLAWVWPVVLVWGVVKMWQIATGADEIEEGEWDTGGNHVAG